MIENGSPTIGKICPGGSRGKIDLNLAKFRLGAAMDLDDRIGGRPTINVQGSFYMPGDPDVIMQTTEIGVPFGSPAAAMLAEIFGDETGFMVAEVGRIIKTGAGACKCALSNQCPGMDEMQLLFAIQAALGHPESVS